MYIVKQQSVIMVLDEEIHRWKTVVLPATVRTASTYDAAIQLVYTNYAESDLGIQSHYAVISKGGKFIQSIKWGSLDGFRKPGTIR